MKKREMEMQGISST
jgi:hypothetical protein